jgi:hypothetical protein
MQEIKKFLQKNLSADELSELNIINKTTGFEERHIQLRKFFHQQSVFDKISSFFDPAWISYEIIINGKGYEF